jgi:histidinol-phosphate aminotransferase
LRAAATGHAEIGERLGAPAQLDGRASPLSPPPGALRSIRLYLPSIHRYPVGLYDRCRSAVAAHLGRPASDVLVTSGVDEALDLFLALGSSVRVCRPGFDAYTHRARVWGKRIVFETLCADWSLPATTAASAGADLAVVASPHNPSGTAYAPARLGELASEVGYLLCDETYVEFSREPSVLCARLANALVFRSFSKSFGLAGLRLGCLVGPAPLIAQLESRKQFYSVDTIALAGVLGALDDAPQLRYAIRAVVERREWLYRRLSAVDGIRAWPSQATFLLVAADGAARAQRLREAFTAARLSVHDCAGFGLDDHFRIAVGTPAENRRVVSAVRASSRR